MITPTRSILAGKLSGSMNDRLTAACLDLFPIPGTKSFFTDFWTWPAAIGHHHNYEGGLAIHTLEVTDYALGIAALFPSVNRDVLIAACLWHDVAKIREYVLMNTGDAVSRDIKHLPKPPISYKSWVKDETYQDRIGHIPGSAILFAQAAASHGVDQPVIDAVTHAILAHHGPVRDWGSPVAPQTVEALILHQADMLSAGYGATKGGTKP